MQLVRPDQPILEVHGQQRSEHCGPEASRSGSTGELCVPTLCDRAAGVPQQATVWLLVSQHFTIGQLKSIMCEHGQAIECVLITNVAPSLCFSDLTQSPAQAVRTPARKALLLLGL